MAAGHARAFGIAAAARLAGCLAALALAPPVLAQPPGASGPEWRSPPPCSGHGHRNLDRCVCDPGRSGAACAVPDCGPHGAAAQGRRACDPGWIGAACQQPRKACPHGKLPIGGCA